MPGIILRVPVLCVALLAACSKPTLSEVLNEFENNSNVEHRRCGDVLFCDDEDGGVNCLLDAWDLCKPVHGVIEDEYEEYNTRERYFYIGPDERGECRATLFELNLNDSKFVVRYECTELSMVENSCAFVEVADCVLIERIELSSAVGVGY